MPVTSTASVIRHADSMRISSQHIHLFSLVPKDDMKSMKTSNNDYDFLMLHKYKIKEAVHLGNDNREEQHNPLGKSKLV